MTDPMPLIPTTVCGSHALPSWLHLVREAVAADRLRGGGPYASEETLVADLIALVNTEIKALVAAGCAFIQVDEPNYVMTAGKHRVLKGEAGPMVEALNAALEGITVKTALHVCF